MDRRTAVSLSDKLDPELLSSLTEENADGELISLDASRKTHSIRFGNIQHDIDFLSGTVEESYIIDVNQLTEENLTHTSPDGRYEVYRIAHSAGGDGWADEFLCRDCVSGQVQQLGILSAMKIGGITSKNELIYHEGHALYSIDLATCERRQPIKPYPLLWTGNINPVILTCSILFTMQKIMLSLPNASIGSTFMPKILTSMRSKKHCIFWCSTKMGTSKSESIQPFQPGANIKAYGPTGCDLILQSDGLYLEKGTYGPIPYLE